MIAIVETSDPVRLSFLKAMLEAADLHPFIFEANAAYHFLPSRLMVPESEVELARRVIADVEGEAQA
jgi:putative signal transducing protein